MSVITSRGPGRGDGRKVGTRSPTFPRCPRSTRGSAGKPLLARSSGSQPTAPGGQSPPCGLALQSRTTERLRRQQRQAERLRRPPRHHGSACACAEKLPPTPRRRGLPEITEAVRSFSTLSPEASQVSWTRDRWFRPLVLPGLNRLTCDKRSTRKHYEIERLHRGTFRDRVVSPGSRPA